MIEGTMRLAVTLPDDNKFAGKYDFDLGTCTGRDDLDVRRETGSSILTLLNEVGTDPGLALTVVCVIVWLVRRKQYPDMLFASVLDATPWGSDFTIDVVTPDDDDAEGKAESANDN